MLNWAWKTIRCFKLAMALEKIALEDDYFVQRKLYPNNGLLPGIVQRAIGIPVSLFTAIFAPARTVLGLPSSTKMITTRNTRLAVRQLFTGSPPPRRPSPSAGSLRLRLVQSAQALREALAGSPQGTRCVCSVRGLGLDQVG